jgi:undecaprenyl-diphosphatase
MKKNVKTPLGAGVIFIALFIVWTILIGVIDVKPVGVNKTTIGFATINTWFHNLTKVNMTLYNITDWLGLVPVFICMVFGMLGLFQLIKRRSLLKVDFDIIVLGVYYVIVILGYLVFEMIPINYRPILINGILESSYPSSTTLLVLSVMPTVIFQSNKRLQNPKIKKTTVFVTIIFSLFMVIGRLVSGVHWLTDIIGSCFLSAGLFYIYKAVVLLNKNWSK